MVNIFRIFEIIIFYFFVAICDLVHKVETIFHLSIVLTASGNLFLNMSDARENANCSFMDITHISEKVSRCGSHLRMAIHSLHSMH